jgi:hypothetical protein
VPLILPSFACRLSTVCWQHDDDVAFHQGLFIRGDVASAQRIMHPSLAMVSPSIPPTAVPGTVFALAVPLCTLTQQSHVLLLLDHHTKLILWSGHDVSGPGIRAATSCTCPRHCGGFNCSACWCVRRQSSTAIVRRVWSASPPVPTAASRCNVSRSHHYRAVISVQACHTNV